MTNTVSIAVLGAGSWGTALASLLARNGIDTRLWGRDQQQMLEMNQSRQNARYLPGIALPSSLRITPDLASAVDGITDVLLVVPSHVFAETLTQLSTMLPKAVGIAWATKGLEPKACIPLHQVVEQHMGRERRTAVLSGPTFAKEVAAGLPTAITAASPQASYAEAWAHWLSSETFRAYTSDDVIGVEIGGAVKNVLAIAAGIADGMGLGANTRAALITRGLAEVQRLGVAMGGKPETLMGLAGLGDLVLTCTDNQSRNRRVGLALAQGKALEQILADLGQVAEGVYAAKEIKQLAARHQVEMPIAEQVYAVLYGHKDPKRAARDLLGRSLKSETD
ncbi:MAG: NAD(P)-dependent glycerol-3-phosphate dehydrogenase [Gammaproteobacteria bacterium]|nr:NAD(P)-dependent glycerol-3-phosphate dehydrogenase [Gammaproteobacteria bacterium]